MKQQSTSILLLLFAFVLFLTTESKAQQQSRLDVALRHVEANREALNLTEADISNFRVSDLYSSRHNGVTHVYLNQEHDGIAVEQAILNVNVLPNGEILGMGNRFVSDLQSRANSSQASLSAADAVEVVFRQFQKKANVQVDLKEKLSDQHYIFNEEGLALEPIQVRLVYQAMEDKSVRLAWRVELYELNAHNWWNVRVDAQNGEVLAHHNQVIHCDFDHSNDCPEDGPIVHSHSKSTLAKTPAAAAPASSNLLANSYNVFPMPVESPNHGNRDLITDPSDATASPMGWHDIDGIAGAEYTITRGNNVHAYHDIFGRNISIGDEPDGGATLDFDYPLDLGPSKPYTQVDPAVVNLFYWNNVMHDLWYQYGFDEASGNFQVNNYGNGGEEGDYVRAEALDGGGTNNANFGTGGDGSGARMQMFIWTDEQLPRFEPDSITVTQPDSVAGRYEMTAAAFGGLLPVDPIIGKVVLVNDGTDTETDACENLVNAAELSGNIALIDRGNCEFGFKSLAAEGAGAVAVIVCNNEIEDNFIMAPGVVGGDVTIPAVMMSLEDCNIIKMGLPDLNVELSGNYQIPQPGPTALDGDFDNGIIIHEYTHGISIRLTGGPSTGGCLSNFEQAGEGWSDWFAIAMLTTENNTAEQVRGMGTYAIGESTTGDGIRPFPYSRDLNVNPQTYSSINGVSVPHGVGSVWATMIWDLYWNLIDVYDFDPDFYNGTGGNNIAMQLVLDGLKLQACNPTFLDARQGIIDADVANNGGANVCLIWETFARRGLGVDAQVGGIDGFALPDACDQSLKITKTAVSEIDAGGVITYSIKITNDSPSLVNDLVVNDLFPQGATYVEGSASCPNTVIENGVMTIDLGNMMTGASTTCTYELRVAEAPFSFALFRDDIEAGTASWTREAPIGPASWSLNTNSYEGSNAWFAPDIDEESDQFLITAEPIAIANNSSVFSFWHRYSTEATWDGGVVEISTDNGLTWQDLGGAMTVNGYNATIQENPASTISLREAFSGNSGGYIQTQVDLGGFSGQNVLFRFRMACDGAVGGDGWYIDNIRVYDRFHSITNRACITAGSGGEVCSEITTVVNGEPSTSTIDLEEQLSIALFPNPAKNEVYLNIFDAEQGPATLNLRSVDGRLMLSQKMATTQGSFTLDVSAVPAGIHFLEVQTANARVVRKLVIQ